MLMEQYQAMDSVKVTWQELNCWNELRPCLNELRESSAKAQLEPSNLRNTASFEKCDLSKPLEELEGAVLTSRGTILRQEVAMLPSDLERVTGELEEHRSFY